MNEQVNTYHLNPPAGIQMILPANPDRIALIVYNNYMSESDYAFDEAGPDSLAQFQAKPFSILSWLKSDFGSLVGGALWLLNSVGQCTIVCEVICLPKAHYRLTQL